MLRALALLAAGVVGVMWLAWEALVLVARLLPVLATWIFWALVWAAEAIYDAGYWLGERIAGWLDRRRGDTR